MASRHQLVAFFTLIILLLLVMPRPSTAATGEVAIYWGQGDNEGTLREACDTGLYKYIMISFLSKFGGNQKLALNLNNEHCHPNNCTFLSDDISYCQDIGHKVLISLGGPGYAYTILSPQDATNIANDVWNAFLGGSSGDTRPLGPAGLDGVDFHIDQSRKSRTNYWGYLAGELKRVSGGDIILTAAPRCQFVEPILGPVVQTFQFDIVWIRFFNDTTCEFGNNGENILDSWRKWEGTILANKMFMGLPASAGAASSGFVSPNNLIAFFPRIKAFQKYGGVAVWTRQHDRTTSFTERIRWSMN